MYNETLKHVKPLFHTLGFFLQDNANGVFEKKYKNHNNYAITIDCQTQSIDYG